MEYLDHLYFKFLLLLLKALFNKNKTEVISRFDMPSYTLEDLEDFIECHFAIACS